MTIFQGVDCTAFQGNIDWRLVKQSQVDFAMLRASMGCENKIQSHTDIHFHRNMHDAAEAGIDLGAYHCLLATTVEEANQEADCFLRTISGYEFSYPVAVDIEDRALRYLQKNKLDEVVQAWCDNIRNAGYYVMVRATLPTIQNRLSDLTMQQTDLWLIKYGETTDYSCDIGIWQYTGAGSVGGVRGRIGRLRALRNYPLIIQKTGDIKQKNENDVAPKPPSSSAKSPVIQAFDTLYSLAELKDSLRELFEDGEIKNLLSKEPQACKCEHKEQAQDQKFDVTDIDENNEPVSDEMLTKHNSKQSEPAQSSERLDAFESPQTNMNPAQPDLSQDVQTLPEDIDKTHAPKNEPSSDEETIIQPELSPEPQQHDDEFENRLEQTETDEDIMSELLSLTAKTNVSKILSPDEIEDEDEDETEERLNVQRPLRGRWKWLF